MRHAHTHKHPVRPTKYHYHATTVPSDTNTDKAHIPHSARPKSVSITESMTSAGTGSRPDCRSFSSYPRPACPALRIRVATTGGFYRDGNYGSTNAIPPTSTKCVDFIAFLSTAPKP